MTKDEWAIFVVILLYAAAFGAFYFTDGVML